MTVEINTSEKPYTKTRVVHKGGNVDAVYGLGLIGAWIYFIGQAATFGEGVLGFLKGIVWPVLLVIELLKYLNM